MILNKAFVSLEGIYYWIGLDHLFFVAPHRVQLSPQTLGLSVRTFGSDFHECSQLLLPEEPDGAEKIRYMGPSVKVRGQTAKRIKKAINRSPVRRSRALIQLSTTSSIRGMYMTNCLPNQDPRSIFVINFRKAYWASSEGSYPRAPISFGFLSKLIGALCFAVYISMRLHLDDITRHLGLTFFLLAHVDEVLAIGTIS